MSLNNLDRRAYIQYIMDEADSYRLDDRYHDGVGKFIQNIASLHKEKCVEIFFNYLKIADQ
jgi:hypothetical protein